MWFSRVRVRIVVIEERAGFVRICVKGEFGDGYFFEVCGSVVSGIC